MSFTIVDGVVLAVLALSGILAEQTEEILQAYQGDFELDPVAEQDGWIRVSGKRR